MTTTNWFEIGKDAAISHLSEIENAHEEPCPTVPECLWPIYSPEGVEWLRGWSSVAVDDPEMAERPEGHGNLFVAPENR